ncbi:Fe-S protein assembly co-chaperone HscB [Solitalea sp. MAHUQ-68]|uniref:Fe-S protein assembly co-chaperone HscB n=1 Tax=Solitalea agri TaxID=2953739 RepID=A0A9X2JE02_9SPHI|nr:Fe-S protein assembly co-chaperone HscB [Solitalea agri]MCO4294204.1 Fe-S protein assembly co-chaperone HscB [Solitalea agri]
MNYFQFYDIPVSFNPDESLLKKKFYALSKQYHPDFYVNESEEKQTEVLELSTLNNNAFKVLSNPVKRLEYVLELNGLIIEGEKNQLPQAFLMEMMDINEQLMELEFDEDEQRLTEINEQVSGLENNLTTELDKLTEGFDAHSEEQQKNILLKIKDNYYKSKYLLRIKEKLHTFATRN